MRNPQHIASEQAYVDELFRHLDAEVTAAQGKLAAVQRDVDPDNPDSDALVRRETEYHGLNAKLDALKGGEAGGAAFALAPPADRRPIFGGAAVLYLAGLMAAEGTAHQLRLVPL